MKLTKSKQFLADAIHASGKGWPDGANWAAQDRCDYRVEFYIEKPFRITESGFWEGDGIVARASFRHSKLYPNWHQTVLSREEYFSAYPAEPVSEPVADADGWIEWSGGECPVSEDDFVCYKLLCGTVTTVGERAGTLRWAREFSTADIISYRLHKPDKIDELAAIMGCNADIESIIAVAKSNEDWIKQLVVRVPSKKEGSKPTIEQLASDYRNARGCAERLQQEADAAKADADAKLKSLELAGEAIDLLVSPITAKQEPELVITDWRDWVVGDFVELVIHRGGTAKVGDIGVISKVFGGGEFHVDFPCQYGYSVDHSDVRFIRRP